MQYVLSEAEYLELSQYKKAFDEKVEAYGVNGVYEHRMFGQSRSVRLFVEKDEAVKILSEEMKSWKDAYLKMQTEKDNLLEENTKLKSRWF